MSKNKVINQVLFIVPTSERGNEIKKEYASKHNFLKVVTLPHLLNEIFELYDDSKILLDTDIALSIIYKIIVDSENNYFKYLKAQSESLNTLYDYFIKLGSNGVNIGIFKYSKEKSEALEELYSKLSDGSIFANSGDEAKFKHSVRRAIQSLYARGTLNRLEQGVYGLPSK